MWWIHDPKRWQREEGDLAEWFPGSQWSEEGDGTETVRSWHVLIQPVSTQTEVELVIADLDRDGVVDISRNGTLLHSRRCHASHSLRPELQGLSVEQTVYLIKAMYRTPPAHPLVWPVSPEISPRVHPGHPHFFRNGALCPIFPKDGTWRWRVHTMCDYLMQASIWLLKSQVWIAGKRQTGTGIWIGSDVDHKLENLLAVIQREDECCCGSAKRYKKCCRPFHFQAIIATQQRAVGLM